MPSYQHPGVYIEELPSGLIPIEAASTSITAFIGFTRRGALNTPTFITKVDDYKEQFGLVQDPANGIRDLGDDPDAFGHAVNAYFQNGGKKAYIVRVATGTATATGTLENPEDATEMLDMSATSPGLWGDDLVVNLAPIDATDLTLGYLFQIGTGTLADFEAAESFSGVTLDPTDGQFIGSVVAEGSTLIDLDLVATIGTPDTGETQLTGGGDGTASASATDYSDALTALRDFRDASILIFPGLHYLASEGAEVLDAALTHAEDMKNRMVIVDPRPATELKTQKAVKDEGLPTSTHSALYYPWLEVANPYYNPDTAANKPKTFKIAPSSVAAGLWSRIDGKRGVWKAPAGLEATVRGTQGPEFVVGNDIQDQLNVWGVNCIRPVIGPSVIWGARTLATKSQPDFRYVPVRRTSILIGESLYNALQAVVFEPNKHVLWASLRANVGNFMDGLFRAGAFQGEKASDAYFVRCGLGDTMTQADIDGGIVRVIVGYAPLKPAEFVIVQIQQKLQQAG